MTAANNEWNVFGWMRQIRSSNLAPSTRLVLLTLVTWLDSESGICYPSLTTLAEGTGLAKSTVVEHLKLAEASGFITRHRRKRGTRHTSTLYVAQMVSQSAQWKDRSAA